MRRVRWIYIQGFRQTSQPNPKRMPYRLAPCIALFALGLLGAVDCMAQAAPQPVAITHVTVLPMDGPQPLQDQTVLIVDGRITALAPSAAVAVPPEALQIDGRGRYLMPGLSDMHAHVSLREGNRAEDYLNQGITVVRNMQGIPEHLAYRDHLRPGGLVFRTAGPALAGRRISKRHHIVTEPEAGRAAVREQAEAGYDYIKVYSLLARPVYEAILDEAGQRGIPVVGHVTDAVPITQALAAGQTSVEHFYGYFWALEAETSVLQGNWAPRRLFHAVEIDTTKLAGLAAQTARAGVWNCPTLWRKDHHLPSPLAREAWETPALRARGHRNRMKLVKALHDAGAGLLVGTDDQARVVHEELALFVEAGLSPYEALQAATVGAATYLGMGDEMGTVEVGKRANLVLLAGNPLEDIAQTRSTVGVFVGGVWTPVAPAQP